MNHDELIDNWIRMDKATVDVGLTAEAMSAMSEEITRLRQRAEAAEAELALVDEYVSAKLNDPYNDSMTFDAWLQSRA
jgi:hypothetical protein